MIINYFDKYDIDTNNVGEKLNIIAKSKTENASYMSNMLIKTLEYLFSNCSRIVFLPTPEGPDITNNFACFVITYLYKIIY